MSAITPNIMKKSSTRIKHGFTLVELLVVIALTAVLFTLIFKPLFDSFNLTSRSGTQIETQQYARNITRDVDALLSSAVFVYDNASTPINLWVANSSGTPQPAPTTFAMLEAVTPARQFDQRPGSTPIDPTTNTPIYAAGESGSAFALPLSPGRSLVRYFIGLVDNRSIPDTISGKNTNGSPGSAVGVYTPYSNRFETPNAAWDNRFTLYKAEVAAYIPDPDDTTKYIPNLGLFHTVKTDVNNVVTITNLKTDAIQLHDPNFFYDNTLAGSADSAGALKWAAPGWQDINKDGKVEIWENWKAVSNSQVSVIKVDLLTVDRDPNTKEVLYDQTTGLPSGMGTLISFEPAHVQNDPMVPGTVDNAGNESPYSAAVTYSPEHANWSNLFMPIEPIEKYGEWLQMVMVYRPIRQNGASEYLSQTNDALQVDGNGNLTYYVILLPKDPFKYVVTVNGIQHNIQYGIYRVSIRPDQYPPSLQTMVKNLVDNGANPTLYDKGPMPDASTGAWVSTNPEIAFSADSKTGLLNFGFSQGVMLYDASNQSRSLPARYTSAIINNGMTSAIGKRYLRLDVNPDPALYATPAALNAAAVSPLLALGNPGRFDPSAPAQYSRVRIIPGTERVYGPDQRPGLNYGHRTQYTRVSSTAGVIGLNEYKILYDDVPNAVAAVNGLPITIDNPPANVRLGYVEFNSQPDTTDPTAPNATNGPNSLPLNKTDNTGALTLAADPVEVYYNFQMNNVRDVVKGDYLTREQMNIKIDMRLYDPRSARPQSTRLVTKVNVRNLPH